MMRFFNLLTVVVIFVAGFALYHMKFETQQLEQRADALNRQMMNDQAEIKVLNAEWAYLSSPVRLEELTARYLPLKPASPKQMLITVANLEPRPENAGDGMRVDAFDVAWPVGRHVTARKVADFRKATTPPSGAAPSTPDLKLAEASPGLNHAERHTPFNPATDKLRLISTDLRPSGGEQP